MESMIPPNAQPVVVWFRDDLRLSDNPALTAAIACGSPLVAVYILNDETPGSWRLGGAARWWLHHSLAALGKNPDMAEAGGKDLSALDGALAATRKSITEALGG